MSRDYVLQTPTLTSPKWWWTTIWIWKLKIIPFSPKFFFNGEGDYNSNRDIMWFHLYEKYSKSIRGNQENWNISIFIMLDFAGSPTGPITPFQSPAPPRGHHSCPRTPFPPSPYICPIAFPIPFLKLHFPHRTDSIYLPDLYPISHKYTFIKIRPGSTYETERVVFVFMNLGEWPYLMS